MFPAGAAVEIVITSRSLSAQAAVMARAPSREVMLGRIPESEINSNKLLYITFIELFSIADVPERSNGLDLDSSGLVPSQVRILSSA